MDLTPENLLQALEAAGNQSVDGPRDSGQQQLKLWEQVPGFFALLQDAYLDQSLPIQVRWIAVIYFKNESERHWRKSAPFAVSEPEKTAIRSKVFGCIDESNRQLMIHNAYAIARLARMDVPGDWPDLMDTLLGLLRQGVETQNYTKQHNVLTVLNQVIKAFSISRFGRVRQALLESSPAILALVTDLYANYSEAWMGDVENNTAKMEITHLCLKLARRLIAEGHERANRSEDCRRFFQITVVQLPEFLTMYSDRFSGNALLEKHVRGVGKLYHTMRERQSVSFVLMPDSLKVAELYLQLIESKKELFHQDDDAAEEAAEDWTKVVVQGMLLIKHLIGVLYRNGASNLLTYKTEQDKEETKVAVDMLRQFFSEALVQHLTELLVTWYLRLRPTDLVEWHDNPEEWANEDLNNAWEYQLRACSEKLYGDLAINFREIVVPMVLKNLEQSTSSSDVLAKDAALAAFATGSAAISKEDSADFDQIFPQIIIPQGLANGSSEYRVLRRRVAIVLGEWITIQCSAENRIKAYELMVHLLNPQDPLNDVVVRITAAAALRFTVDDWDFEIDGFLPFVGDIFVRLFALLKEVTQIDSKVVLLRTVAVVADRIGARVSPYADTVLEMLPALWEEAGEQQYLRVTIVQVLTSLVQSLGRDSTKTYNIGMPVMNVSLDRESPFHAFLYDDSLLLWEALVKNAPEPNDTIFQLFPAVTDALDRSTENLYFILKILEGYALLSPDYTVQKHGHTLLSIFGKYMDILSFDVVQQVAQCVEYMTFCSDPTQLIQVAVQTGFFKAMVNYIIDKDQNSSPTAISDLLQVLARMVIAAPNFLMEAVPEPEVRSAVITAWLAKFQSMCKPHERKLATLGLTALISSGDPVLKQHMKDIVGCWVELTDEVAENEQGDCNVYYSVSEWVDPDEPVSPHTQRQQDIKKKDPIHTYPTKAYIQSSCQKAKENVGDSFQEWFSECGAVNLGSFGL